MDDYKYKIGRKRVEFFHWHQNKLLLNDDGETRSPIKHIIDAAEYAEKVLHIECLTDVLASFLDMMDEEHGCLRKYYEWPIGFSIGICGEIGTVAFCSVKDQYSKARGRQIVMGRLNKEEDKFRFYVYDPNKYDMDPHEFD